MGSDFMECWSLHGSCGRWEDISEHLLCIRGACTLWADDARGTSAIARWQTRVDGRKQYYCKRDSADVQQVTCAMAGV